MAVCRTSWGWVIARVALAGLLLSTCIVGCNRKGQTQKRNNGSEEASLEVAGGGNKPGDPGKHQPMKEAAHLEPPSDSPGYERPPDTTMTGKETGKLFAEVQRQWDQIRFVNDQGKPLSYSATIETSLGNIEINLRPDWAPNHVRSFVALARVGYYDGLIFDGMIHDEVKDDQGNVYVDEKGQKFLADRLEAGGPGGIQEPQHCSIGYWLKPEMAADAHHDEGAVGASHRYENDSAACKFYITLGKARMFDGAYTVFGQVTKGMEVAREIFKQPARRDDRDPEEVRRPVKPIVIQKVTIHVTGSGVQ